MPQHASFLVSKVLFVVGGFPFRHDLSFFSFPPSFLLSPKIQSFTPPLPCTMAVAQSYSQMQGHT